MESIQIETLYLNGIEYRKSFSFGDQALEILSTVKDIKAQELIINNLENIHCVSRNIEMGIAFFVSKGPNEFDTGYKIVNGVLVEKSFSPRPIDTIDHINYTPELISKNLFYGKCIVNGKRELDVYFRDLINSPIADKFKIVFTKPSEDVFYGCKVKEDGTTYRHKSFVLNYRAFQEGRKNLLDPLDIKAAKEFLLSKYQV